MRKILYIEPYSGIAGDMFAAAMSGLFTDLNFLYDGISSLPISNEFRIFFKDIQKKGITARYFKVELINQHSHSHHHGRTLEEIISIIKAADKIKSEAKELAINIFRKLAEAEATVHGTLTDKVHFHEVGAIDAIVDITAAAIMIAELNPDEIISAPISVGKGTVKSAHGVIPVPSPATTELIKGKPVNYTSISTELTTPTGAAILATAVTKWNTSYEGILKTSSYGAGTKDIDSIANILRVSLIEDSSTHNIGFNDEITVLECNIDDLPAEHLTYIGPQLLKLKALDYAIIPATVKKGRQGMLLKILCFHEYQDSIINFLLKETTTLGVRYRKEKRIILNREIHVLETPYGDIRIKVSLDNTGKILKVKPEQCDIERIASEQNNSYMETYKYLDSLAQQWLNKQNS